MDAGKVRPTGRGRRWAACLLAAAVAWPGAAGAAERVALVIGNGTYKKAPLKNPVNDATDVGAALHSLGFTVTHLEDANQSKMREALVNFVRAAAVSELAVVYYAGHGMEVDGRNFLVPVDASLASAQFVEFESVPLELVMRAVERARGLGLVVLDACRDNPFVAKLADAGGTRSIGRGLAPVAPAGGTLVAYAAEGGSVAADGTGRNSPYTEALLRHLKEPGLEVRFMFAKVRDEVLRTTGGKQKPFTYGSLSSKRFYLAGKRPIVDPDTAGGVSPAVTPPPPPGGAARAYEKAERQNTVIAYRIVVDDFKGTTYARLAQAWIDKHEEEAGRMPPGTVFQDCPECPEVVVVPEGSFRMGSTAGADDERPVHWVKFARPFAVGVYEVTFEEWSACVSGGGCGGYRPDDRGWGRGRRPVMNVSWKDAQGYVRWLSGKTGETYRLLSEAEWEYVARAGMAGPYHSGASLSPSLANYGRSRGGTAPVGSYPANGFGLHDVHGNVWEWVEDCWNGSYRGAPVDGSAWESGECGRRVLRGGSWADVPGYLRSAYRNGIPAGTRYGSAGFRVARTLTP